MKTYLTYGFYSALGGALLTFALYFLGFHTDAAKLGTANIIQSVAGLAISVTVFVLGVKARRAEVPPSEDFGYGRALGAGFMIALFASILGSAFYFAYISFINPSYLDVMLQAQTDKFEAQGLSAEKVEQITAMTRSWMKPGIQAAMGFLFSLFFGTLVSLVTAAFLKRRATEEIVAA